MMLFVGGFGQGQAAYAADCTGKTPRPCATPEEALSAPAIDGFHQLCRRILEDGGEVTAFVEQLLVQNPGAVVVSDEIGLGVVPLDPGRALCRLAAASERVERVCCGLGVRLK